ncbi:mucin-binding protein [Secundilactobacillus silagei]|uniref:mucin-binding protein n=1 Tax=Secundilactobacillus silagei TaxID=1293415 RepID=UPI0020929FA9|nr:hypothetical protein [Secundilactobacillus silagei]
MPTLFQRMPKKESPKGSYDKNSWIIYQAEDGNPQQAINKPDNKPVVTNITTALSDAEPSKSINYSFVVNYQADDKTLTTVVKDESGADVTTWKYVVPDEYVGKFFTMAVSGATAASHAAYSAKINSYSYQAATATLNIISSGLPADITGPTQNGIKGMASDVVGFYRAGTTAPTTVDGKTVTKAIAVPDIGTNYLADNQAVELSGADNVINLVFTHDVNVRVQAINEDGKSIAGTQPLKTIGRPGTVITQTPTVTGYTLVPDQTLEIPETDGTVNAVYKANDQNATVKFVTTINGETKPVAKDLTLPGVTDGKIDYALIAPTIQAVLDKGYNLSPKMGSLEPIFDNDDQKDQTLEVVFVPIAPVKLSVKLVPVDAENVPLDATETTITGLPGTTIAADDYPQVPGYTVQDSTLTFPDKPDQKNPGCLHS